MGPEHTTNASGATWSDDQWLLTYNPLTGKYWTATDVNNGMEFGFRTGPRSGETPRISAVSALITYRLPPTAGTIYIGGVFEETRDNGFVTDWTKYYGTLGRTIAIRKVQFGDQLGALYWPLHDHLGTTVGITDGTGTLVSSQKYWPYGGTRMTSPPPPSITETDKLYTGQQKETGDASLGLYNYKARFYSTTLGRFVSADSVGGDLNRYSYVGGNPTLRTDPTGHNCESPAPCPSRLPTPAESDPLTACVQNFGACLAWSLAFEYGNTDLGLVIVMGLFDASGDIARYGGYAEEFLERTHPGCKGQATACWAAAQDLMKHAGADAVYDRFGLKFIQSDPGGLGIGALVGDRGMSALDAILRDPRSKKIAGVIGHSLGALTVATYFATHERMRYIPYFLDEPPFPASWAKALTSNFAGSFGWWSCDDCGSTFAGLHTEHGPHNEQAGQALDALDRKRAELTVDMVGG